MAEEQVTISQNELNRMLTVVSNVQKDNNENEKGETPVGLSLSQSDLDSLYKKGSVVRKAVPASDEIIKINKPQQSEDDAAKIRARKIAERKAHSAQILAQVKADAPRRILVAYGISIKKNAEIEKLVPGDTIRLDRMISDPVRVYVEGKLFAEGEIGNDSGVATIKLTKLAPKGGR